MGFDGFDPDAPTPKDQLVLAYVASVFTFTCLYGAHTLLLQALWPEFFELDRRLRMTNAERMNGVWHSRCCETALHLA
jgi:hypothetical protein